MDTRPIEETFFTRLPVEDGKPVMPMGKLTIERKVADRPTGAAFLAHHWGLDMPVMLRVMYRGVAERIQAKEALRIWCQRLARVRHQNLAGIFDMGIYEEHYYVVLECLCGIPMCERMKEEPYSPPEALRLLGPIAQGLGALWRHGLIHRGVSPHRVLIASDGRPVLDLVVLPQGPLDSFLLDLHAPFMAGFWPREELCVGHALDWRSDQFSFGASLFFALTGQTPFGKGPHATLYARTLSHTLDAPPPDLPPVLRDFLATCLERELDARFSSPERFFAALHEVEDELLRRPAGARTLPLEPDAPVPTDAATVSGPRNAIGAGDTIGHCRLEQQIGAGAFGIVFRARHTILNVAVAVKLLPVDIAARDPSYVKLFLREARTAARIRHANVIGVFEAGEQHGQYYLVMEYAPHGSVLDRMNRLGGRIPPDEAKAILEAAARGLAAAEQMNIVHRDIKPENLLFGSEYTLKVSDLGLAKRLPKPSSGGAPMPSLVQEQLTLNEGDPNLIMGTPAYMAPEMALSPLEVDTRADQYSLGVTAYQMLSGQLPFHGKTHMEVLMKHIQAAPVPLHKLESGIPAPLSRIVMRLLEKDPKERFPSAAELADELRALQPGLAAQ